MTRRPTILVLGMITKIPVAGAAWQYVHYLVGLERLGFDVYYAEAHGRAPTMLMQGPADDSSLLAASHLDGFLRRFGFGDRWAFHALHDDGRVYGFGESRLRRLYKEADLIVNLHGSTVPTAEQTETGRLVYLETDPVELEIELHDGLPHAVEFAYAHRAFSTWALNYGSPDCLVPLPDDIDWLPAPPPVLLDLWPGGDGPGSAYTTVGNWRQHGEVTYNGERYTWSKHHEFLKVLELPTLTGQQFELALGASSYDEEDRRLLEAHGWHVRSAAELSADLDAYRSYVAGSRGEFTVAKDQNVRLRSGWFSERSATYLAAGRPVVTQDTGFGSYLPIGEGLFAVTDVDEAIAAFEAIEADFPRHARAAREIAREYLDADVVLPRVLDHYGVPVRRTTRTRGNRPRVSVVIPCFDLGAYLSEAVESVRAQSYSSYELIVVDDGSTDEETLRVLDRYRREGTRVIRTPNRGAPAARNRGIEESCGEYVLCLDADDVLEPAFLEETVAVLESSPPIGIVTTGVTFFGEQAGVWRTDSARLSDATLLWRNCIASASLFRRRCWEEVGGYGDLPAYQDWDFWLGVVERGWEFVAVSKELYRYRVREGSISAGARSRRPELLRLLVERHAELYRAGVADILVEMDETLRTWRARLDAQLAADAPGPSWPAALVYEAGTVSIVVPCFDLGEFVEEAVASTFAQTRPADEVIVVDDGSTDTETLAALERCAARGARVLRKENGGVAEARNYGIERARGEYVLCLDADDLLVPEYLEQTVPVLEQRDEVGVVTTHVELFSEREGIFQPPDFDPHALLWRNCVASCSLFRKSAWHEAGGYRSLDANEDWDFWLSVVERGWRWTVVPQVLYRYRKRASSRSAQEPAIRARLLREQVARHRKGYREGVAGMLVGVDREIAQLDAELTRLRRENVRLHARLAELDREAAEEPPDRSDGQRLAGVAAARAVVEEAVPAGAHVAVVSRGDEELLDLGDRQGLHFPQTSDGRYLGYHPASGPDAVALLEELRGRGAEFLALPASSAWWLDFYPEFRRHLLTRYWAASRDERCLVFDLRQELHRHSFSIVICTYNRAALLGKSIESAFAQDYPHDLYEIIVVGNNSTDDTEVVERRYTPQSPVPFRYVEEKRQGLSYARNLGAELATGEFVAFLDDDAEAVPHWLASFNGVIDRCHALVVGGRIEKAFPDGFTPPDWFGYQYMKGFFGLNYREWGKPERILRVRPPLYIGGGNSAYAKRVFRHFGGFDVMLGRDAKTLLAGEETHLNLVLEHNDIPIYYTDDAVIWHYIEPFRVTQKHILRKAYWAGVSNAMISILVDGWAGARRGTASNRRELRHLLRALRKAPRDTESFSRLCRIVYHLSFLRKLGALSLRKSIRRRPPIEIERTWGAKEWLTEVERWPDNAEKHRHVYEYALQVGDDCRARDALDALAEHESDTSLLDGLWGPVRRLEYERLVERVRAAVEATVPEDARVLIVSKGDDRFLELAGPVGGHFPQLEGGVYAGSYPADGEDALAQLAALRRTGATHIVFPAPSLWWLSHYGELADHLRSRGRVAFDDDTLCVIFELEQTAARVRRAVREAP